MSQTPERLADLFRIAEQALVRDGAERAAYLDTACGADADLRREVETVLAEVSGEGFLDTPPWQQPPPTLVAGQRLGPYEVIGKIGEGGMGAVYRARDSRLERDVALKILPAATLGDSTARARLLREARLASKLNHPHICAIYDVGEAEPSTPSTGAEQAGPGQAVAYIGMELVEGQTLAERVRDGPLPNDDVVRYGQQLAAALAHAHRRGVVHRDFKSANVVVTPDGQAKVLDFGLAKRLATGEIEKATTVSRHSLSEPGVMAGTVAYMAPEQLLGRPADARSDIWALGVVLYELVVGQRPFQGETAFELSSAILNQPLPPAPTSMPAPLGAVIVRCLAKQPDERYQQASEVEAALAAVAAGTAVVLPHRRAVRAHRWMLASVAAAVLVVAGLLLAVFDAGGLRSRLTGGGAARATPVVRLVVLPFANVSGDATQEYVSDGLTTEMIALLGRLHPETLRVIARTTAMRYKKTDKAIDQIGRELAADYILEGSAQREAGRIRITAELIKVADQTQLWADRYERELAGILALQNDVAQQVAKALALKLLPAEQARLAGAKTVDPEVYDLCLKGMELLGRFSKADYDAAERYFQRALEKAPASAHAGMAGVWLYRRQLQFAPAADAGRKARAAALKAIELDDSLAEAHAQLASVLTWTDFNFPEAEREFKRTLELDPDNPLARVLYGHLLMILRRPDEAMRQSERAVTIDPLNVAIRALHAANVFHARRYDDAIAEANEVLRMQPGHLAGWNVVFCAEHMKQRHAEAIRAAETYYESVGWPDVAEALKQHYADSGYAGALRRAMEVELANHANEGPAWDAATTYAIAGDRARALDLLEQAYEERDANIPYISCSPILDPLRGEPRFQALLKKLNLPR